MIMMIMLIKLYEVELFYRYRGDSVPWWSYDGYSFYRLGSWWWSYDADDDDDSDDAVVVVVVVDDDDAYNNISCRWSIYCGGVYHWLL